MMYNLQVENVAISDYKVNIIKWQLLLDYPQLYLALV